VGKRKDIDFSSSRPPFSKKGKGKFSQFRRKGGAVSRPIQSTGAGTTSRQPSFQGGYAGGATRLNALSYPQCVRCE